MPRWNNPNCGFQKGHPCFLTKESIEKLRAASKGRVIKHTPQSRARIKASLQKWRKYFSIIKKGALAPHWKGGISPECKVIRSSLKYRLWRESVFARDDYTCMGCKERGVYLNAHHIKPFAAHPELRFSIDNGISLCVKCHKKTDTFGFYVRKERWKV
jgi:hypothetical protein